MAVDSNAKAISDELKRIGKSLDALVDLQKQQIRHQTRIRPPVPYSSTESSKTLGWFPTTLDWVTPPIEARAQIIDRDGKIHIEIVMDSSETERVKQLIKDLELGSLSISAMGDGTDR